MPDLVTHALAGHVLQRASGGRLDLTLVLAGSMLPDVVAWLPMKISARLVAFGVPPEAVRLFPPMHSPLLVVIWGALLGLLFVPEQASLAWRSITLGGILHVALDLCQDKLDGGYLLLYPLSLRSFQLGLVPQDAWVVWTLGAMVAAAVAEASWRLSRRP